MKTLKQISLLLLLSALLTGCYTQKMPQGKKEANIYDGSIGMILGCMFSPAECEKFKQESEQEEITKDFDDVDKDLKK